MTPVTIMQMNGAFLGIWGICVKKRTIPYLLTSSKEDRATKLLHKEHLSHQYQTDTEAIKTSNHSTRIRLERNSLSMQRVATFDDENPETDRGYERK